jgi:uncharacterized protein (DUF488 family)
VKRIFTLGTDRRSEEDFIEILLSYSIKALIDVRSVPKSKIPTFNRHYLEGLLENEGIQYHYLGAELGGLRKGGFTPYLVTDEFARGVDALESVADNACAVIVCAERFPWKCHRKWIARELHKRGWRVEHIIDKDKVWVPK